jgi:hypothetical protein
MSGIRRTQADDVFSKQIRARDGGKCRRCGSTPAKGGLDCAHMFGRRCAKCTARRPRGQRPPEHSCTRLDPDNAMALCTGCHFEMDTHPWMKEALFRSELGDERFDALAARAHQRRDRVK